MAWGMLIVAGVQLSMWALSMYLADEFDEDSDRYSRNAARGGTTVAQEGEIIPLVYGRAKVRETSILAYGFDDQGDGTFMDYIRSDDRVVGQNSNGWNGNRAVNIKLSVCQHSTNPINIAWIRQLYLGDRKFWPPAWNLDARTNPSHQKSDAYIRNFFGPGDGARALVVLDPVADVRTSSVRPPIGTYLPQGEPILHGLLWLTLLNFYVGKQASMPGVYAEVVITPREASAVGIESRVGGSYLDHGANPAAVIYQLLTDKKVGIGLDPSIIDIPSFNASGQELNTAGDGFSAVFTKQKSALDIIRVILRQVDGVVYLDPVTQKIHFRLIRSDYGPVSGITKILDESNIEEVLEYQTTTWKDAYTKVTVSFEDRDADYAPSNVTLQNFSAGVDHGRTKARKLNFPGVKTQAEARRILNRELEYYTTPQVSVRLKVSRAAINWRPGDVLKWSWPEYGITDLVLRIRNMSYDGLDSGAIVLVCTQDRFFNAAATFTPPGFINRHSLDLVYEPPGGFIQEDTWAPTSPDEDGWDVGGALPGTLSVMMVDDSGEGTASTSMAARKSTFAPAGVKNIVSTPTATVSVAYGIAQGLYHDTATGIVVSGVTDSSVFGSFSENDILNARNTVIINDELLSFESATDLGGGSWRLNNVWRGLVDTLAQDHEAGDLVFFLSKRTAQTRRPTKSSPVEEDTLVRLDPARALTGTAEEESPSVVASITTTNRTARAIRPTQVAMFMEDSARFSPAPEQEYSYNPDDVLALAPIEHRTGSLGDHTRLSSTPLTVWSNDLYTTWARRSRTRRSVDALIRGDKSSQIIEPGDDTSFAVEYQRPDGTWVVVDKYTVDGTEPITGSAEVIDVASIPSGEQQLRVCAHRISDDTNKLLCARSAEEVTVDILPCRQLLANRMFRPYHDPLGPDSGDTFGKGYPVKGNTDRQARGWTQTYDTPPLGAEFGIPVVPIHGDATTRVGYAVLFPPLTDNGRVSQIVSLPNGDTKNLAIELSMWVMPTGVPGSSVLIGFSTLDASGAINQTYFASPVAHVSPHLWQEVVVTFPPLSPMGAGIVAVKALVVFSGAAPGASASMAVTNASLTIGRKILPDQLTNGNFMSLTGWTQTGWSSVASVGATTPVDYTNARFAESPVAAGTATISQTVSLPLDVAVGDYARIRFWVVDFARTTISFKLKAQNGGSIITEYARPQHNLTQYIWSQQEAYLEIPESCTSIKLEITIQGTALIPHHVGLDQANLTFIKTTSPRRVFDFTATVPQVQPRAPHLFAEACQDMRVLPNSIFDMQGQTLTDIASGYVLDGTAGVAGVDFTIAADAVGMSVDDQDQSTALELSALGGMSCTDTQFMDPKGRSFAIYFQYRAIEGGGFGNLFMKVKQILNMQLNEMGFQVYYNGSTHNMYFAIAANTDLTGDVFLRANLLAGTPDDGGWHWACAKFNATLDTIEFFGDTGASSTVSTTTITAPLAAEGYRFYNDTDPFTIGRDSTAVAGILRNAPAGPVQLGYVAMLRGKSADLFDLAKGQKMWTHGGCPAGSKSKLPLTYTRASRAAYEISPGRVAMWSGSAGGGNVQVPVQYDPALGTTGLVAHRAMTNLMSYANLLSSWPTSQASVGGSRLVSERGLREMMVVSPAAAGGYVFTDVTSLTPLTEYTLSFFHRASSGTHDIEVIATEDDSITTLVTVSDTSESVECTRAYVTFTTQAGQTQTRLKFLGGTSAAQADIGYHGIMLTESSAIGPVIYNDVKLNGTLETCSAQTQYVDVPVSTLCGPDQGSIGAVYTQPTVDTGFPRTIARVGVGSTNNNGRDLKITATGVPNSVVRNAVGALYHQATHAAALVPDQEIVRYMTWSRKANLSQGSATLRSSILEPSTALSESSGTANTKSAAGHTRLYIGCSPAGEQCQGPIAKIVVAKGEMFDPRK